VRSEFTAATGLKVTACWDVKPGKIVEILKTFMIFHSCTLKTEAFIFKVQHESVWQINAVRSPHWSLSYYYTTYFTYRKAAMFRTDSSHTMNAANCRSFYVSFSLRMFKSIRNASHKMSLRLRCRIPQAV
jgi:hypothetical protein